MDLGWNLRCGVMWAHVKIWWDNRWEFWMIIYLNENWYQCLSMCKYRFSYEIYTRSQWPTSMCQISCSCDAFALHMNHAFRTTSTDFEILCSPSGVLIAWMFSKMNTLQFLYFILKMWPLDYESLFHSKDFMFLLHSTNENDLQVVHTFSAWLCYNRITSGGIVLSKFYSTNI